MNRVVTRESLPDGTQYVPLDLREQVFRNVTVSEGSTNCYVFRFRYQTENLLQLQRLLFYFLTRRNMVSDEGVVGRSGAMTDGDIRGAALGFRNKRDRRLIHAEAYPVQQPQLKSFRVDRMFASKLSLLTKLHLQMALDLKRNEPDVIICTAHKRSLRQGNIFTGVYLSTGGVSV